ncbi:hypothetical protein HQ545_07815 [Candidatus Woesearchaeota archaeon]|nr:hypothetical protein [Candidatus Woesearchaeota archaeon]
MVLENIIGWVYHLSSIMITAFFLFAVLVLRKEKPEIIKSRLFLKYSKFKSVFYLAFAGSAIFLTGNILDMLNNDLNILHDIGEVMFNLCLASAIAIFYIIIRR